MTKEEAITRLKNMDWLYDDEREQNIEAIDMAIEALSAEAVQGVGRYENAVKKLQGMPKYLNGVKAKQIKKLSAEAEWIPCSEKMPSEKDGRVLVTKHDEVMIATYSEFSGTWYVGEMCAVGGEDPIAWMPLPKPYREDGE